MSFRDIYRPLLQEEYISDEGQRQKQQEQAKRLGLKHIGKGVYTNPSGTKYIYNKDAGIFTVIPEEEASKLTQKSQKAKKTPEAAPIDHNTITGKVSTAKERDLKTGKPKFQRVDVPALANFHELGENFHVFQDTQTPNTSAASFSVAHSTTGAKIVTKATSIEEAVKKTREKISSLGHEKFFNLLERFRQDHLAPQIETPQGEDEKKPEAPQDPTARTEHFKKISREQIKTANRVFLKYFGTLKGAELEKASQILKKMAGNYDPKTEKEVLMIRQGKGRFSPEFLKFIKVADYIRGLSHDKFMDFYREATGETGLPKPKVDSLRVNLWDEELGRLVQSPVSVISSFTFRGHNFHIHRSLVKKGDSWFTVNGRYTVSTDTGVRILDGNNLRGVYKKAHGVLRKHGKEKVTKVLQGLKEKLGK